MLPVDVIVPQTAPRRWQKRVIERLLAEGYDVAVVHQPGTAGWPAVANAAFALERLIFRRNGPSLADPLPEIPARVSDRSAGLRLDLTGEAALSDIPTISIVFDGAGRDFAAATAVAAGELPTIEAVLDGKAIVGRAWPMIDKRESAALGTEDVLARAVTLGVSIPRSFAEGRLAGSEPPPSPHGAGAIRFASAYLGSALPRFGREALRCLRYRHAHWRVGFRFTDGPGVAETGALGTGWSVLPDSGDHFYADPFPFQWRDQTFLFVEDYPHTTGKAVISAVSFDAKGVPQTPQVMLEEPHHLSYPQLFERDGEIWMLPEGSGGGRLTLYRASPFPDRWIAEAVLLEGEISDATLWEHDGLLWLFATDRDGHGSTSDTMVVFFSPALSGPWRPHPMNPVMIDRRMARPGGAFVRKGDGGIVLPVQDGTRGYGGGLGLSELLQLDARTVRLSPARPVETSGGWPYPKIHTLNRAGRLETIDGIAAVRKNGSG